MVAGGIRVRSRWGVMVFNFQTWQRMLQLALNSGWRPSVSTQDYYLTPGTTIPENDVLALAASLERALPDIPNHQAIATASENTPAVSPLRRISEGISLVEWFSGETKQNLEGFILFCRFGGDFQLS